MISSGDGLDSRPISPPSAYQPVTQRGDIESLNDTDEGVEALNIAEKHVKENDCTLVRSFTPGNRQLDHAPPPDGGLQAWLQGMKIYSSILSNRMKNT